MKAPVDVLSPEQKRQKDLALKALEDEEKNRALLGRVEALEQQLSLKNSEESSELMAKKEGEIDELKQALVDLYSEQQKLKELLGQQAETKLNTESVEPEDAPSSIEVQTTPKTAPYGSSSHPEYDLAEQYFKDKQWANAIEAFENFRTQNSQDPDVPLAVYKIGVCFQELGMVSDAKVFYKSTMTKYPRHKAARYAKYRLENL